jgi:hypothetical protein
LNLVDPTETLARFLYHKNQYRPSDQTVKYAAFIPPENKRLSIFRIFSLSENKIWELGDNLRSVPSLGRADFKTESVSAAGLTIEVDDIPARHANIVDWPAESSAIKLKALLLAEKALLRLKEGKANLAS